MRTWQIRCQIFPRLFRSYSTPNSLTCSRPVGAAVNWRGCRVHWTLPLGAAQIQPKPTFSCTTLFTGWATFLV